MGITKDKPDDSRNLREQAEKRAKQQIVEFRKQRGQDTTELVHELRVHQIELEIQNEELRNAQLELAESRNKYCELYDFAPVGYFTLNKEGLVVEANLTGATFLGEERGNLLNSKFSHFITPDSQDKFYLHRKQVVESGTRQNCEVKLRRKDGTEFLAQLASVAVAAQKDEYDQFRLTMIDITERKQAEEEMLWKTALLESQVEANLDGVLVVDGNNQKILTNKRLIEMWKVPQHIIEDKDDTALLQYVVSQTKYPEQFLEKVKYLYAHKDQTSRDEIVFKNGMVFDRYSSPVIDKSGKYFGRIWTFRDITDRKRAEEKLQQASAYNRSLIEASPDPLVAIGPDGKVTDVNTATETVTGYTRTELVGTDFSDYFTEPKMAQAGYQQVFQKGVVFNYPLEIRHRDGRVTPVLYNASIYRNKAGEVVGVFAAARDITKRKRAEEALQESETRFRELFNNMSSGVAVYEAVDDGSDFIIRNFNTAGQKMDKTSREDAIGKRVTEVFPGVKAMGLLDVFHRVWKTGKAEQTPITFYKNSLISGWRENYVYKLPSGEIVSTYDDVTERQAALEHLREERNLLRTLIDNIPDKVYVKDKDSRFIVSNKTLNEHWLAQGENEIIGKTDFDLFEPAKAQEYFDKEQEIIRTGQAVINQEGYCEGKAGNTSYLLVTKVPLRDSHGSVTGLLGIHRDITERKLAEEKLGQERNLLQTLFDHIPDEVYIKDKDSRMVACNKAVVEYWGLKDKSSIIGKTDFDLFDKGTAQKYFDEEKKVIRMGQSVINIERQCLVRKDKPRWILATKVPLKDNQGNVIGIVGINRDITERKQVEHEILEHQNHLKQLAARLTLTEERERRRIASEIHDEISQTLAIVNIKLDTLRNSTLLEASAAEIAEISSSVEKVIQETRTLTFELSNPLLYELGLEVAVAEWLNERVQVKHGIATEFQDDGKSKPLDNDMRILLFRNTRELLMNCIKHANAGKVRVNIRRINSSIEVVVEDNGVGFDPAEVRLTAGKKSKFGLFSIRESIENLGGHFIIESKPGAGCKAIMTAPLKDQSHEKEV